ncbi:Peptidyl-prolyl cis-trans isomerase pin4 [Ophidiomyces ophidiicola]|uniref:Peptidyl-prolyl cis-trans isomerase pin4 n=1 Tax=Ophidiomyces ophidiicola TaxID=1387563 RepID=A0ACB8V3P0_9EURO|nr:Peptidyl-prolyl cis-trans isomerase pin4 [Ophidiomyces ophidiicola]
MNSYNQSQDMYHHSASRSPGAHRHVPPQPQQQLHRQPSRQFDAYGLMPASMFDDLSSRYDMSLDRATPSLPSNNFPYDVNGAQTWNANGIGAAHTLGNIGANPLSASARGRSVRGRTGLPATWLDQQQPSPSAFPLAPGPVQANPLRPENHGHHDGGEDELIPTAIVIKNIPFAVKKEQLIQLMTDLSLPLPYAFNYHFDNGVFRGLAFANFTSAEETAAVIEVLNHFDLNGRKLRVEYKKMLPAQERERIEREKRERRGQLEEQHRPIATTQLQSQNSMSSLTSHLPTASSSPVSQRTGGLDMNDQITLQFYSQLLLFKQDPTRESVIFPSNLVPLERRIVHTLAHNMGLGHSSRGSGDQRQVHVFRITTGTNVSPPIPVLPATIHQTDSSRRSLNRAATIDFGEARNDTANPFATLRSHHSGYLSVLDSPGTFGGNPQNLRAAKSFADLRSYTPSPAPSTASYPAALHPNGTRIQGFESAASGASHTPTLTPAPGSNIVMPRPEENLLVNTFSSLQLGTSVSGGNSSPRRLRQVFSWEQQDTNQSSATAPIGSNRAIGLGTFDSQTQDRLPLRQPRGPAPERGSGFRRPNGHQSRGSDEIQNGRPEIVVE